MAYKDCLKSSCWPGLVYFRIFTFKLGGKQTPVQSWVISTFSMRNLTYPSGLFFMVSPAKAKVKPGDWGNSLLLVQPVQGRMLRDGPWFSTAYSVFQHKLCPNMCKMIPRPSKIQEVLIASVFHFWNCLVNFSTTTTTAKYPDLKCTRLMWKLEKR